MILSKWKAEFDSTMEGILKSIAEIERIRNGTDDEPRDRHLILVPSLEESDDA